MPAAEGIVEGVQVILLTVVSKPPKILVLAVLKETEGGVERGCILSSCYDLEVVFA